jgi:hypothetical protein
MGVSCLRRTRTSAGATPRRPVSAGLGGLLAKLTAAATSRAIDGDGEWAGGACPVRSREESRRADGPPDELDLMLANPRAYAHLPPVACAFDATTGVCCPVQWANSREPRAIRRTALTVGRLQAINRQWKLN